jgi:hypothetical protein
MGSVGVGALADQHGALRQLDVSNIIGRTHNVDNYLRSRQLMGSVRQYVTLAPAMAARNERPAH